MGSEWILGRLAWGVWIGFEWLRTGTGGGLLWVRWWTFGFLRHGVSKLVCWFLCQSSPLISIRSVRIRPSYGNSVILGRWYCLTDWEIVVGLLGYNKSTRPHNHRENLESHMKRSRGRTC
jgi:hypothetical protein